MNLKYTVHSAVISRSVEESPSVAVYSIFILPLGNLFAMASPCDGEQHGEAIPMFEKPHRCILTSEIRFSKIESEFLTAPLGWLFDNLGNKQTTPKEAAAT